MLCVSRGGFLLGEGELRWDGIEVGLWQEMVVSRVFFVPLDVEERGFLERTFGRHVDGAG